MAPPRRRLPGDTGEALERFERRRRGVVTLDLRLPPDPAGVTEGMRLLGELLRRDPRVKVLVVTGNMEQESALAAIRAGAFDYFLKPIELDELRVVLRRAVQIHRLETENDAREQGREAEARFGELLGVSTQMRGLFALIDCVAQSATTVLIITGESGAGKELVARTIHARSRRGEGPFVPIDCGAIPESPLEAELFGHEKGAFTGAHVRRQGRLELAQGGTCLLDEIGERRRRRARDAGRPVPRGPLPPAERHHRPGAAAQRARRGRAACSPPPSSGA